MTTDPVNVKVVAVPIEQIVPYEKNAKKHPQEQIDALAENIRRFGWDQPIVVDKDMVIIKGHGRRLAALALGLKKVPVVIRADMSKEEANLARLTDNRVASQEYDSTLVQEELARISDEIDLTGLGFSDKELAFLTEDLGDINFDIMVDDVAEAVDTQKAKNDTKISEMAAEDVKLAKVFGFTSVPGRHERAVRRLVLHIEATTGLTGAAAFAAFAESITND